MRRAMLASLAILLACVGAAAGDRDVFCFDTPTNIPAGAEVTTVLEIPCPEATIDDLDLHVKIVHTWVGDLVATLAKEGSGSATVIDRPGVPGQGTFGCSGDDIDAVINDEAVDPLEDECQATVPTIQGEFIGGDPPDDTLMATWDGEELCGTWTFTVAQPVGQDSGFIDEWCLIPGPPDPPGDGAGDGGGVPAATGAGVFAMVLLLLGASAYALRRRAAG